MRPNVITISALSGLPPITAGECGTPERLPIVDNLLCGIEVETENVTHDGIGFLAGTSWGMHDDASLRDGVEFVLNKPLAGNELAWNMERFFALQEESKLYYTTSPRAGTHIHVNVTDRTLAHTQAMFTIMYIVDRLVFQLADTDRMWCSYCNSLNTLPSSAVRSFLSQSVSSMDRRNLWSLREHDRYYGFNVSAMWKYGTMEFRYFPTATSAEQLWCWMDFCQLVYKAAEAAASEVDAVEAVLSWTDQGAEQFIERVFGDAPAVVAGMTVDPEWREWIASAKEELVTILSIDYEAPVETSDMNLWERISVQGSTRPLFGHANSAGSDPADPFINVEE